jgi:hypothetical protein
MRTSLLLALLAIAGCYGVGPAAHGPTPDDMRYYECRARACPEYEESDRRYVDDTHQVCGCWPMRGEAPGPELGAR